MARGVVWGVVCEFFNFYTKLCMRCKVSCRGVLQGELQSFSIAHSGSCDLSEGFGEGFSN